MQRRQHHPPPATLPAPPLSAPFAPTSRGDAVLRATGDQPFIETALLRPFPRPVRLTRTARRRRVVIGNLLATSALVCWAGANSSGGREEALLGLTMMALTVTICVATLAVAFRERNRERDRRLLRDGVATTGTVTSRNAAATRITYQFQTVAGETRVGYATGASDFGAWYRGDEQVTILYNPANPGENCPYRAIANVELG